MSLIDKMKRNKKTLKPNSQRKLRKDFEKNKNHK
jgi:hypothetical protein